MVRSLLHLALLCSLAACAAALPAVDDASFESLVLASDEAWVLEFSSPRCGTCQELAPLYAAVAGRLGGSAQFGEVNIDTDGGMALAKRLEVLNEGVPNVRAWARKGAPSGGDRVFSGWELPSEAELERSVVAALAPAVRARCVARGGVRHSATRHPRAGRTPAYRGSRRLHLAQGDATQGTRLLKAR